MNTQSRETTFKVFGFLLYEYSIMFPSFELEMKKDHQGQLHRVLVPQDYVYINNVKIVSN